MPGAEEPRIHVIPSFVALQTAAETAAESPVTIGRIVRILNDSRVLLVTCLGEKDVLAADSMPNAVEAAIRRMVEGARVFFSSHQQSPFYRGVPDFLGQKGVAVPPQLGEEIERAGNAMRLKAFLSEVPGLGVIDFPQVFHGDEW